MSDKLLQHHVLSMLICDSELISKRREEDEGEIEVEVSKIVFCPLASVSYVSTQPQATRSKTGNLDKHTSASRKKVRSDGL